MTDRQLDDARAAAGWIDDQRFVDTASGKVAIVERGSGPTALFLHGFPLSGFQWRGAISRLAEVRRCIAPDSLGLGYTEARPGQAVDAEAQVVMVIELLDRLETGPVDIVANDSNTGVAQLVAARYPTRVRSLLLTNGDTEPDDALALTPLVDLGRAGQFADVIVAPHLADRAVARSPDGLGTLAYTDSANFTDAVREYYLSPLLRSAERKRQVNAYAAALTPNPLKGIEISLRKLEAPVRIVWGTGDIFFSRDAANYLDSIFPNSRGVRAVPDAKLFFPEEYPDVIAEEARALWAD